MKLNNLTLEEWLLRKAPQNKFPLLKRDYKLMYANMADYLKATYHKEVTTGALIEDKSLLTDHGPDHIDTVIRRASVLVDGAACVLTAYETYLLLCAIHFHDIGNMYGRAGHEARSREVIIELGELAGTDDVERKTIHEIAQAHGGAKKDKLESLPLKEPLLGLPVRQQLLAAILKFADELADDHTRKSALPWASIPKANQVYHKFAETLKTVEIDHASRTVKLFFSLSRKDAVQKFGKSDTETTFLLDEIKKRTFKTHLERLYCMRFLSPEIRLDKVAVSINFIENLRDIHDPILYTLSERGYPDEDLGRFDKLCPNVIDGKTLKKKLLNK